MPKEKPIEKKERARPYKFYSLYQTLVFASLVGGMKPSEGYFWVNCQLNDLEAKRQKAVCAVNF